MTKEAKEAVCTECGEASEIEICYSCQKKITDNCPGDLLTYLFGVKGDHPAADHIRSKKLAMAIHSVGIDVKLLWEFWLETPHLLI